MEKTLNTRNLNYNFIAVPTNLFFSLDVNVRNGLTVLLQLQSVFGDADGYFFRTNEGLQSDFKTGKNLTIAIIESLFQYGLLQVKSVGFTKKNGKRSVNFFRVNVEAFKDFEQFNIYTITKNEELHLETVNYKAKDFKVTYTATTEENTETTGNTPQIVSNETIEETPSNEAENTPTTRETANPDIVEFQPIETASAIPSDTTKIEKRSIDKATNTHQGSPNESAKKKCIQLLRNFDTLKVNNAKELIQKETFVKDYILDQHKKGLLDFDTQDAMLAVLRRLREEKIPF